MLDRYLAVLDDEQCLGVGIGEQRDQPQRERAQRAALELRAAAADRKVTRAEIGKDARRIAFRDKDRHLG